jgi:hypothetical protein
MIGLFSWFRALSLKVRFVVIGAGSAAIAAGSGLWHHKILNSGWNAVIAAQDRRAIDAARSARANWRTCVDDGGVWNASSGVGETSESILSESDWVAHRVPLHRPSRRTHQKGQAHREAWLARLLLEPPYEFASLLGFTFHHSTQFLRAA